MEKEYEVAQLRLLRYAASNFISALKYASNESLQKQLVNLLQACTRESPSHSSLVATIIKQQGLPPFDLHDQLNARIKVNPQDQERVLKAIEVSSDGKEFTANLNEGYLRLICAAMCFTVGMQ